MHELEFFGGPFDGHKELLGAGHPADELAWLVCADAFGILSGPSRRDFVTITSVAIYELEVDDGLFRYEFLVAISFKALVDSMDTRCIRMMKASDGDSYAW